MKRPLNARERVVLAHMHSGIYGTTRDARRARLLWAFALAWVALFVVNALTGCAPHAHNPPAAEPPAGEGDTCESEDDPLPGDAVSPLLLLEAVHCTGHWVDPTDSSTRLDAHPDTGLCTFACVWQEPKCRESWYGDTRCYPAHAAQLGMLCAELGGRCERAEADGLPYCVAP